jgi:hypothetical protein
MGKRKRPDDIPVRAIMLRKEDGLTIVEAKIDGTWIVLMRESLDETEAYKIKPNEMRLLAAGNDWLTAPPKTAATKAERRQP